jgi:two-component system, NtrC family, sensor histidine kinase HydH
VVELCRIPVILDQSINEAKRFVWIASITGGLLIFLSLIWIVMRASRVMKNQQQRLIDTSSFLMIGQTASAITHAMRNPLASIRACAELSLTDDMEGVRESAMDIMSETDRLDRWARDLLKFSVAITDTPEIVDVNGLVKMILKDHEPILSRSAISVQLHIAETQLLVVANITPLSQVFGNLIINAVESMVEYGELTVTTSLDSRRGKAVVSIAGNGPGLSEEIKGRLFESFATTKSTGTGLGLALSRHLVEHFDGSLEIISEAGQGVTATVSLPLSGRS